MRLADTIFLGWAQPHAHRPYHPLGGSGAGTLPCAVPLFLPHDVLNGHVYISGGTQSGKSSAGMASLLMQVLAGTHIPVKAADGRVVVGLDGLPLEQRATNALVLILDMKGDLAGKNLVEERCRELGLPFHFFACEPGADSSYFNPLTHLQLNDADALSLADSLLASSGLFWGSGYGRTFFAAMNRLLLLHVFQAGGPHPKSYREIVERIMTMFDPDRHRAAMEVVATLSALAAYPLLQPAPPGGDEIRFESLLGTGGVVYAWLPLSATAFIPRDVCRLLLFSFVNTVRRFNLWNPARARRAYVFIDEAQVLAGMNIETLFTQASSCGTGVILANQSPSDLNSHENPRLWSTVETNTRLKIHFTAPTVDDRQRLLQLSRETLGYLVSQSWTTSSSTNANGDVTRSDSSTVTHHPQVHPAINLNDLNWVNTTPRLAVVELAPDAPTTRLGGSPTFVYIPFAVSESEYNRLRLIPLKRKVASPVVSSVPPPLESTSTPALVAANTYDALDAVYRQLTGRSVTAA